MVHQMTKAFVLFMAAIFFFYGLLCAFFPSEAFYYVTAAEITTSSGIVDLRATYGGMSLGVGLLLYTLSRDDSTLKAALLGVLFVMTGMAATRLLGMVVSGPANAIMYLYLMLEIAAMLAAWYLLKKLPQAF